MDIPPSLLAPLPVARVKRVVTAVRRKVPVQTEKLLRAYDGVKVCKVIENVKFGIDLKYEGRIKYEQNTKVQADSDLGPEFCFHVKYEDLDREYCVLADVKELIKASPGVRSDTAIPFFNDVQTEWLASKRLKMATKQSTKKVILERSRSADTKREASIPLRLLD